MKIYKFTTIVFLITLLYLLPQNAQTALFDIVIEEFSAELVIDTQNQTVSQHIFSQEHLKNMEDTDKYELQVDWKQFFPEGSTSSSLILPLMEWSVLINPDPTADPVYDLYERYVELYDANTGELLQASHKPGFDENQYVGRSEPFALNIYEPGSYLIKFQLIGDIIYDDSNLTQTDVVLKEIELYLIEPEYEAETQSSPIDCGIEVFQPKKANKPAGIDPVYLHNGEFYQEETDLRINGRGMDVVWKRKFRNFLAENTDQGNNWDYSYNIFVETTSNPDEYILHDGNTRKDVFSTTPGIYQSGFFRTLEKELSTDELLLHFNDKSIWRFHAFDGNNNDDGKIKSITDRNGNSISFTYYQDGKLETITDTLQRTIGIDYYSTSDAKNGKVHLVTDFGGRAITYDYYIEGEAGGNPGDLKSVTSPAVTLSPGSSNNFSSGKTRTYTYYKEVPFKGYLETISDGKGQVFLRNEYGDINLSFGKVVKQKWGNFDDIVNIYYDLEIEQDGDQFQVITVNDRSDNVRTYKINEDHVVVEKHEYKNPAPNSQMLSYPPGLSNLFVGQNMPVDQNDIAIDPLITELNWDSNDLVTKVIHPNGNTEDYIYNTGSIEPQLKSNLTKVIYNLGQSGAITEEYAYENEFGGGCCFNFVSRYKDGEGRIVDVEYDGPSGNPVKITRAVSMNGDDIAEGIVTDITYNQYGQVLTVTHPPNPSGHRRQDNYHYYTSGTMNGYLWKVIEDNGGEDLTTEFTYDQFGNVTTIKDPRSNTTTLEYNELDQVYRVTKPTVNLDVGGTNTAQYTIEYFYDENNNITKIEQDNIDELGNVDANEVITTLFNYDILNYVQEITKEISDTITTTTYITYDGNRNVESIIFGEANKTTNPQTANRIERTYNGRDLLSSVILAPNDANESVTTFEYDDNGNLIKTIRGSNADGVEVNPHEQYYQYDNFDRLEHIVDPMANAVEFVYDKSHNIKKVKTFGQWLDVENAINEFTFSDAYDNSNFNVTLSEVDYGYDLANRLESVDRHFFDENNPVLAEDGNGDGIVSTSYIYNNDSPFLIRVSDDNINEVSYTYDSVNRLKSITDAKGNSRTYDYDNNNNVHTVTETDISDLGSLNETFVTSIIYDELNRVLQLTDPISNTFSYSYDSRNNVKTYTDALNVLARYEYDGLNRLTKAHMAESETYGITIEQVWDLSSRLTKRIDGNGNTTAYDYDPLNRLDLITFADGETYDYVYDVHHNLKKVTDPNDTEIEFDYDVNNRVTSKTITPGLGVNTDTISESFAYDGLSRLVLASDNDSDVNFTYDSLSNVIKESLSINGGTTLNTTAKYDGLGNLKQIDYPSGRHVGYSYDDLNRIDQVNNVDAAGTLLSNIVSYDYIGRGRLEKKTFGGSNGIETSYTYDAIRRIDGISHSKNSSSLLGQTFAWDAMSNKTQRTIEADTHNYTYDKLYRLESGDYEYDKVGNRNDSDVDYSLGAADSPTDLMNEYTKIPGFNTLTYDDNGNLTDQGLIDMTYDYRNQMVSYDDNTTVSTYRYDALGRRISKTVGGTETRFYNFGSRVIEETDGTNAFQANYVFGNYIDEVLSMNWGGNDYFYHTDDLYNVMALSNSTGSIVERYDYGSFGTPSFYDGNGVSISSPTITNPYLFNGRRLDDESGLYYYRTRYMDPYQGRFTTRDSIGIWGDPACDCHAKMGPVLTS